MSTKTSFFGLLFCIPFATNAQWIELYPPSNEYIIMSVVNKDTLVYSDDYDGKIYNSFDGGETWSAFQNVVSNTWIYDFDFVSDQIGYACGGSNDEVNRRLIFRTEDAGMSWDTVYTSPSTFSDFDSFHGIDFLNSDTGFVCSEKLYRTFDGGQTMTQIPISQNLYIRVTDIYLTPGGDLYLMGNKAPAPQTYYSFVYRSGDLGESWSLVYSDTLIGADSYYAHSISAIDFPTAEIGYAVGRQGTFLKTVDAGLTWVQIESDLFPNLYIVDFLTPEVGFINSLNGIYRTNDGGENWELQYIHDLPIDVLDAQFATTEIGYAVVDNTIYKTTNGGYYTAVIDLNADVDIQVFPNPSKDILNLNYPSEIEIQKIELMDIVGNTIYAFSRPVSSIDVSKLPAGNYLLKLETNRGFVVKKVVVD